MISLQTPGTGLDDFESRIGLGMCRAALDCVEPEQLQLEEEFDRYLVHIAISKDRIPDLDKAIGLWCIRALSDQFALLRTPGFRPLHLEKQATALAEFGLRVRERGSEIIDLYSPNRSLSPRKGAQASSCGHTYGRRDKLFGALLAFSPQLGQPTKRNDHLRLNRKTNKLDTKGKTLDLCPFCGALALLGTASFQIDVQISSMQRGKRERFFFMPRFRGKMRGEDLLAYIVATKHIRPRFEDVPSHSMLLALLSCYPHISRLKMPETFFVVRGENVRQRAWRYHDFREVNAEAELSFLGANSYNVALAQDAYSCAGQRQDDKSPRPELIGLLSRGLRYGSSNDILSFYREYTSVHDYGGKIWLPIYLVSTSYIAKEVLRMDEKLIDDPNIRAVASMLRFFVTQRKFGYVDSLRSSRDPDEFERHLLSAQRDAASVFAQEEGKKTQEWRTPFLPSEENIRCFLKALESNFEQVRTLVCLLAFTYWRKEE